jgi:hypothetical protein
MTASTHRTVNLTRTAGLPKLATNRLDHLARRDCAGRLFVLPQGAGPGLAGCCRNAKNDHHDAECAALLASVPVLARSPAPPNAQVYFIWPSDGMVIHRAFWVRMGLRNMGVAPKGTDIASTGHHHLLIDTDCPRT